MKDFDYIISGSGAAGLSLLMRIMQHVGFKDKRILVADRHPKNKNDRTWCFWENKPGLFEPVVHHKWEQVHFFSNYFSSVLNLAPFTYKMIRALDFYNYVLDEAAKYPNITFKYGNVEALGNSGLQAFIIMDGEKYTAQYVFNSILFSGYNAPAGTYNLLQHFKGWMVETEEPFFTSTQATLMDFRVSQQHGTTFGYVLPVSATRALVEYTLFTKSLLKSEQYDEGLREYISTYLRLPRYGVIEEEFGIIPMTNMKFPKGEGQVVHIGTAGGQTKASSGYTFQFIQKQTEGIVEALLRGMPPFARQSMLASRFHFYDSTLLHILYHNKLNGDKIFADLFSKNTPDRILRFLDNESSVEDELNIIGSLPTGIFMRAALKEIFN